MEANRIKDHRSYKMSDQEVVKRVLCGEKELYEILLRRYNQTLYRTLRSYFTDKEEVEDIMQEVWLKVWKKLGQFRQKSAFPTWLIRIGINEALMQIRKRKKYGNSSAIKNSCPQQFAVLTDPARMNPEKNIIRQETRRLLEKAVDRLPEKYRLVYILREIEGMDTAETANCLRISESNVKVRLHRARSNLKGILYELTGDTEAFEFGNSRCDRLVEQIMKRIL